jgi:glutamine synthetase
MKLDSRPVFDIQKEVESRGIEVVRFSFVDQHGILRGKTIAAAAVGAALENGVGFPSSLLLKDSSNRSVFPVFTADAGVGIPELSGAADALMVADPTTWRVLPWAPKTGWLLCDLRYSNGKPMPFDTRGILRQALARLSGQGFSYVAGLEIEFHIFRTTDARLRPEDAGQPGRRRR